MITVVSVEDGVYFAGKYLSGNTVNVTLTDGTTTVRVDSVLIFEDDEENLEDMFSDAVELAAAGHKGYTLV